MPVLYLVLQIPEGPEASDTLNNEGLLDVKLLMLEVDKNKHKNKHKK